MKKLHSVCAAVVVLACGSQALADNCKSPRVRIFNEASSAIKITQFQYFDGCDNKWRTENVATSEISAGSSHDFTDNLEFVGGCAVTKFKVYRARRNPTGSAYGSYSWTNEIFPSEGGAHVCNTNVLYSVHTQ